MRRELAICFFLTWLLATVFSPELATGLLLLSVSVALPAWQAIFGAGQSVGNVDQTNVVGWKIRYADASISSGTTFLAWTLAPSTNVVTAAFFLADQYDEADDPTRYNFVNLFAHETNYWFVDGLAYGGGSELPVGLPLGAAKAGVAAPATNQEAADRDTVYNAALADRVWG